MTTDLERARAHLLFCQELLREMRQLCPSGLGLEEYEDYFLSALSWVWEEQEKAHLVRFMPEVANWSSMRRWGIPHL